MLFTESWSLLKVMLWSTKKKSRTGVLSLGVMHGACNEVWWSSYPTNLRPPYQRTVERTRVLKIAKVSRSTAVWQIPMG